jgi:glutathione S-transferase
MITIYGREQSRSFRGVWALVEADVKFDYVHISRDALPEGYETLNTQIKVPTLVDADLVLTESAAIVNYAGALSKTPLIPTDPKGRAAYDNMCYFIMTELEQPLWSIGKHMRPLLPKELQIKAMATTADFEFNKAVAALLPMLADRDYAVGNDFSLADVLLAQTLNWADRFERTVPDSLLQYRDRMYERAGARKALELVTV